MSASTAAEMAVARFLETRRFRARAPHDLAVVEGTGLERLCVLRALWRMSGDSRVQVMPGNRRNTAVTYKLTKAGRAWLAREEEHEERLKHGWSEAYADFLGAGFSQADARDMADQRADFNIRSER